MRVNSDCPKIAVRRPDVFMTHQDLDDEQRVDGLASFCQLLESREHHAGEGRAQPMRCSDESAAVALNTNDLLIGVPPNRSTTRADKKRCIGAGPASTRSAVEPRRTMQPDIRVRLLEETLGGD